MPRVQSTRSRLAHAREIRLLGSASLNRQFKPTLRRQDLEARRHRARGPARAQGLEDYFQALEGAGFTRLPRVRELRVTPEISAVDPEFFASLVGTPLHLAMSIER